MTDDLMDARLRDAGERWRVSDQATAKDLDGTEELLELGRHHGPRYNRWLALASAAVVAAALLVGGAIYARSNSDSAKSATNARAANELRGVRWTTPDGIGEVVFLDHLARIYDGCSGGLYRLSVSGDRLTIGKPVGTRSTCAGASGFVDPFDKMRRGTVIWTVDGHRLNLTSSDGDTLTLTTNGDPAPAVVGTDWVLERVSTGTDELDGSFGSARLRIAEDGSFVGNDLCNELRGKVKVADLSITFEDAASLQVVCHRGTVAAGKVIDALFKSTVDYSINGTELFLSGTAGTLVYRAAEPSDKGASQSQLVGVDWTLSGTGTSTTSGNSSSGSGSSAVGESVLRLDGSGGFTISHRCYTDKGTAKISARTLTLSAITLKSAIPCTQTTPGELEENDFVDTLLKGTATWEIDDQQLTISRTGKSATFDVGPIAAASRSLDFIWQLHSIRQGAGPYGVGSAPKSAVPLTINHASLHAKVGCWALSGSVRVEPHGQLKIGDPVIDTSACSTTSPALDLAPITRVLNGSVTYQITGDQLTITKSGVGELVFTKS